MTEGGRGSPGTLAGSSNPSDSEAGEAPSRAWREQRFDSIVARTLQTAAGAAALLYAAFTLSHVLLLEPPVLAPMVGLGTITAATYTAVWWASRRGRIPQDRAEPLVLAGLVLSLVNTLAISLVRAAPEATMWFGLTALAGGLLFLRRGWFAALVGLDVAAWSVLAFQAPPDPRWMEVAPFVLLAGLVLGALTFVSRRRIYEDVLDRELKLRRVNQELERARKRSEAAERLQSEFLANVSHDVRTPVTAIIGEAQLLQGSNVDADMGESLETIEASARHLLRLIDDLLDISKVEAGHLEIQEQPTQLDRVLRDSLAMVQDRAERKGLALARHVDSDVPPAIRTDPHRLQQILGNLLTNAVKFTEEGRVDLEVTVEREDPLELRFAVTDTGPGIPQERRDDLFRAFSRLGQEGAREAEGTGLGLAICSRLVDLMGGEIGLESTVGEGSVFWFTLPAEIVDPEETAARERGVSLSGRSLWLVGTSEALGDTLRSWGLAIERLPGLTDLDEAVETRDVPDAVVLDRGTLRGPEDVLEDRVQALRDANVPVLVLGPDAEAIEPLSSVPGPGTALVQPAPEAALREALEASLRGAEHEPRGTRLDPELSSRHPLGILVVDDSPVTRRVMERMLERLGYAAEIAERGDEALDRLVAEDFDLALVDIELPGLSGIEVARRLRDERPGSRPRLVALTGHTDEATIDEALDAGMDAHLAKPVSAEQLVQQIEATPAIPQDED